MDRRKSTTISVESCERCGYPVAEHHVGDVCVERGDRSIVGLPWALRAVQLSGGHQSEIDEPRSHPPRLPA
jgi:hypothetical protein